MQNQRTKSTIGFTLVEILVGAGLMLIVFSGIFGAYQFGLKVIGQSEARITATALANQKIEAIRNASYQDVGTVLGIPPGIIQQEETVVRNGLNYIVSTTIVYIDDPYDSVAPADPLPTDYKRAKVEVSWTSSFQGSVVFITDIAPKGVETSVGGGTLSLNVFDAEGVGVSQARVHIVNEGVNPTIDATYQIDNYGAFVLPGIPASVERYHVTASKQGYSQERTYGSDELDAPLKPHASVYEGQVTGISFAIDKMSAMNIESSGEASQEYPVIGNVPFTLVGSKLIGQNEGEPVYKYSQAHTTNGAGEVTLSNMEWDSYSFSVSKQQTGLDLVGVEVPPGTVVVQPVGLLPDTVLNARLVLAAEHSLLVTVRDEADSHAIFGAQTRLFNAATEYDETRPTNEDGQAFFIPLESDSYSLEVQMQGYQPSAQGVAVSGTNSIIVFLQAQ
jgi:type II secretory pathway pseudopilin PulG